jgi:hypothetical protein
MPVHYDGGTCRESRSLPQVADTAKLVVVDPLACERVASILARVAVPEDREEVILPLPSDAVGNYHLALVAICHQTQALRGRVAGVMARGWDYLQGKWLEAVTRNTELLAPMGWASLSADLLVQVFADEETGNTLTAVDRRAAPGPTKSGFAARAGMRMSMALNPADVARSTLAALGRRSTVLPGFLSNLIAYELVPLPRWAQVRIMDRVLRGMTEHRLQADGLDRDVGKTV